MWCVVESVAEMRSDPWQKGGGGHQRNDGNKTSCDAPSFLAFLASFFSAFLAALRSAFSSLRFFRASFSSGVSLARRSAWQPKGPREDVD